MKNHLKELLLQSLEHERAGAKLYAAAVKCARNEDLRQEWERYRGETGQHEQVLRDLLSQLELDPEEQTPGRRIVHDMGMALVGAVQAALGAGDRAVAQIVASECVLLAESRDHLDWVLIGEVARQLGGAPGRALQAAFGEVEEQEEEHLSQARARCRELWLEFLGATPPDVPAFAGGARGAALRRAPRPSAR